MVHWDDKEVLSMNMTHINSKGEAEMVDVSGKIETKRCAKACGTIHMNREAIKAITDDSVPKGDVIAAARIAGIMAVKSTPGLIPLCHTLLIDRAGVDFTLSEEECSLKAVCTVSLTGRTGAEMEALTGVSVALLTVYDMLKAIDKDMEITDIYLMEKRGGKNGDYRHSHKDGI